MNKYTVIISENAQNDLRNLSETISYEYKAPVTAKKYLKALYTEMSKLSSGAEAYLIQTKPFFRQFGFNVRAITYKKMTIVYVVANKSVYIKAVIPSKNIRTF